MNDAPSDGLAPARARWHAGLVALALVAGCANASENIARRATPASIRAALESLSEPENRRLLNDLMDNPEVRQAAHELAESITKGVLDGLTDEARAKKLQDVSDAFVRRLAKAVGESLEAEVTPRVVELLRRSVEQTLDAALSDDVRRDAQSMVQGITRVAVSTMTQTVADGLRDDIGPATRDVLVRDIGPALEQVIAENIGRALEQVITERLAKAVDASLESTLKPAARELSREAAHGVVLGLHEGLVDLEGRPEPAVVGTIAGRFHDVLDRGEKVTGMIAWILAILALILALWLARTYLERRREQERRLRFERGLLHLMTVIKKAEDRPWSSELRHMIKERARSSGDAEAVNELLRQRSDLRLESEEPPRAAT
ncbi:MAG: hypothetical protein R3A51_14025 [Nannocystaceae bacterium]